MAQQSQSAETTSLISSFNSSAASTYERRVGSCTRAIAAHILILLPSLPSSPTLLDNACGTGAATTSLLSAYPSAHIHAVDNSAAMISVMESLIAEKNWEGRVTAQVMDGQDLRFEDGTFDASVTNFGVFYFPDPVKGAREMYRTLKSGGTAVVTCWREIGFLNLFYPVQEIVKPEKRVESMPTLEKWMVPQVVEQVMRDGGFEDVKVHEKEVAIWDVEIENLASRMAETMEAFVGGQWTQEEMGRMEDATMKVWRAQGDKYFIRDDGKVGMKMVAWIAVGRK